jgi:hypothetical protein
MTTRNYDCTMLTKLRGDRTAAAFVARQNYLQLQAQPGITVKVTNPQTGNYDESNLTAMRVGNTTVNAQFFPTKVITPPCACELPPPVGMNFTMPMGTTNPSNGGTQYVNQGINPNPYVMSAAPAE